MRLSFALGVVALSAGIAQAETPRSPGILEFGSENTLFVAEAARGVIHAYKLPKAGAAPETDAAFNLLDVDALVAEALGAEGRIVYGDLSVHPVSRKAYVSLTATINGAKTGAVVSISREGDVERIDLDALASTSFAIEDAADQAVTF